jgi:hypothetical protein
MYLCSLTCCDETGTEQEVCFSDSRIDIKINDSLPMIIRESDYDKELELCMKEKHSFIDPKFLPNNKALG